LSVERKRAALDECLDRCFAALDQVAASELRDAALALERRGDALGRFGGVLSAVASRREYGTSNLSGERFQLRRAIEGLDDDAAGRLEGAAAPFWAIVLEARFELGDER
jgi:hypothetical protein